MITGQLLLALLIAQQADNLAAARAAEQEGRLEAAESEYLAYLATHQDAEVYQRLGLVRHLQNKFDAAIVPLRRAVELNPKLWGAHLFLGIDLYRTNQFPEALTQMRKAAGLQPTNPEIRFWIGVTQLALKEYLSGFTTLEQLLREQPTNAEVLRVLAESYATLGSATLSNIAELHPDSPAGLEVQGQALEFEGNTQAAGDLYRRVIALDSRREGVHAELARTSAAANRTEEALNEFRIEAELDPTNPEANYALGSDLVQQHNPAAALPFFRLAAMWSRFWVAPWIALAQVSLDLHDKAGSRVAARRALEIAPQSSEAAAMLALTQP